MNIITEKNAKAYDQYAKEWDFYLSNNLRHLYLEKPAMQALIPGDLAHKNILSIGVGAGDELGNLIKQNPLKLVCIDISSELLKITKEKFPSVEIEKMDMMNITFPDESFDFVYSSLAFHYANNWDALLSGVNRVLKKNGLVLFSTHHPEYWGTKTATGNYFINNRGVKLSEHVTTLPGGIEVVYYNHPSIDSILESLNFSGFKIIKSIIPKVIRPPYLSDDQKEEFNNLVKNNEKSPIFFVVLARKN